MDPTQNPIQATDQPITPAAEMTGPGLLMPASGQETAVPQPAPAAAPAQTPFAGQPAPAQGISTAAAAQPYPEASPYLADASADQPILACYNLVKTYGILAALKGISFQVGRGRILGLLGPNGSGKTTLIKLINGLLLPTQGELFIGGHHPGIETRRIISYLPDRNFLDGDMDFNACCALFRDFYADFDERKAREMLHNLGVNPKARFKTLSKGNREKVQLILVMSRQAELYVLDEPIAGVDPATRDYILQTIIANYNPGATVIISTHLIADVEKILDDVLFLKSGQIALYDSADDVRNKQNRSIDEVFRAVFMYQGVQ